MMVALAIRAALANISRLPWRYIGLIIAVAAALWFAFDTGRDNMRAKLQPKLDAALANVATLKAGLATQNAAIAAQGQQQAAVAKASTKAIQRGAERRGRVDAMAARVEAVEASGAVVVPDDVRALWDQSDDG